MGICLSALFLMSGQKNTHKHATHIVLAQRLSTTFPIDHSDDR